MKMEKITFIERVHWNSNKYGQGRQIKRSWLIGLAIFACVITPATNWMIPLLPKFIKKGMWIRW